MPRRRRSQAAQEAEGDLLIDAVVLGEQDPQWSGRLAASAVSSPVGTSTATSAPIDRTRVLYICDALNGFDTGAENSSVRLGVGEPTERGQKYQRRLRRSLYRRISRASAQTVHLRHHHVQYADIEPLARGTSSRAAPGSSAATGSIPHDRACLLTISRFVVLSSTIRIRLPRSAGSVSALAGASTGSAMSVMRKVDPCPSTLSTEIEPPINSTMRFEIARPSPVPP